MLLKDFIHELESIKKKLNKVASLQLRSKTHREEIRKLIEKYFENIRPTIAQRNQKNDNIDIVDKQMQTLLELCHKEGKVKTYVNKIADIRSNLITVDSSIISLGTSHNKNLEHNSVDLRIQETLDKILPSAAMSYRQAIVDLTQEKRFSWRGPATDLRETLRETLDHLAPDADVQTMAGYVQNKDTNGPTMKQKVRFILSKRGMSKSMSEPAENASDAIESSFGPFVRSVYTRSSVSTHTPTEKKEVIRIRDFVRVVLSELLEIQT